jgi:hypothetical protein
MADDSADDGITAEDVKTAKALAGDFVAVEYTTDEDAAATITRVAKAAQNSQLVDELAVGTVGVEDDILMIPVTWHGEIVSELWLKEFGVRGWREYYETLIRPESADDEDPSESGYVWTPPAGCAALQALRAAVREELVDRLMLQLRERTAARLQAWGQKYESCPLEALATTR